MIERKKLNLEKHSIFLERRDRKLIQWKAKGAKEKWSALYFGTEKVGTSGRKKIVPSDLQFDHITSKCSSKDFNPSCADLLNLLLGIPQDVLLPAPDDWWWLNNNIEYHMIYIIYNSFYQNSTHSHKDKEWSLHNSQTQWFLHLYSPLLENLPFTSFSFEWHHLSEQEVQLQRITNAIEALIAGIENKKEMSPETNDRPTEWYDINNQ